MLPGCEAMASARCSETVANSKSEIMMKSVEKRKREGKRGDEEDNGSIQTNQAAARYTESQVTNQVTNQGWLVLQFLGLCNAGY